MPSIDYVFLRAAELRLCLQLCCRTSVLPHLPIGQQTLQLVSVLLKVANRQAF